MHRHRGGALQRQSELAERVAEADRLLGAALGVGVLAEGDLGPGQRSERAHHAVAVIGLAEPGEGPLGERLGLGDSTGPQAHVGHQRLHHQQRPRVAPPLGIADHRRRQRLGLVETTLEVGHVGEQALRPVATDAVAEPVEASPRFAEERLGVGEVATLEGGPRQVVADPRLAALVAERPEQRHRLAEVRPGRRDRAAEHLGEAAGPQCVGESLVVTGPAEDVDGRVELAARRGQVALHVGDGAEPPPGLALGELVVVGKGALQGVPGVGVGRRELAHVDLRGGPDEQQLAFGVGVGLAQGEGPPCVANGVFGAARFERRLGGLVQGVHGVAGQRSGHSGNPADLADQLGRGGGVVGEVFDLMEVLTLLGGEGDRHAGVALRSGALGERLVGDLTDDIAAEPPPATVELEDSVGSQLDRIAVRELLVHRRGEVFEGLDRPARSEHGGVVDDGPPRRRELVEAGGDEGAQRARQVGLRGCADREGGELDEEQRVAATPVDEVVDERVDGEVGAAIAFEQHADERTGVADGEGTERHAQQQRPVEQRRWPQQVVVGALAGDQQEWQVGERADDDGEEVAHARVGPLQVVDPQHRHPRLGMAAHRVGDDTGDAIAGAGRVELVEVGRVAEQVGDDAEQLFEQLVARLQRPQVVGALFEVAPHVIGAGVGLEGEQRRQSVAQGRPQARLAVRRARRLEDDRLVGELGDDAVGEARLAAARLADDRHHAAVSGAHEGDRRIEEGQLVGTADERDVAAHRPGAGRGCRR